MGSLVLVFGVRDGFEGVEPPHPYSKISLQDGEYWISDVPVQTALWESLRLGVLDSLEVLDVEGWGGDPTLVLRAGKIRVLSAGINPPEYITEWQIFRSSVLPRETRITGEKLRIKSPEFLKDFLGDLITEGAVEFPGRNSGGVILREKRLLNKKFLGWLRWNYSDYKKEFADSLDPALKLFRFWTARTVLLPSLIPYPFPFLALLGGFSVGFLPSWLPSFFAYTVFSDEELESLSKKHYFFSTIKNRRVLDRIKRVGKLHEPKVEALLKLERLQARKEALCSVEKLKKLKEKLGDLYKLLPILGAEKVCGVSQREIADASSLLFPLLREYPYYPFPVFLWLESDRTTYIVVVAYSPSDGRVYCSLPARFSTQWISSEGSREGLRVVLEEAYWEILENTS